MLYHDYMVEKTYTLIVAIGEVQAKNELNSQRFAAILGVDAGYYSRIKSGKRKPGRKFLSALSQKFPELDIAIIQHMKANHEGTEVDK